MKAFIIGLGSIGKRHAINLSKLGVMVVGFDPREDRREEFLQELKNVQVVDDLSSGFSLGCDMVVVASPSEFHYDQCLMAVNAGSHVLVEKPLATKNDSSGLLLQALNSKKKCLMMGSNWKFHPGPIKLKEIIDGGEIGKILAFQVIGGQYLPDWHPWEDYRDMYSARVELGGGILLDNHEIDLITWLLGSAHKVNCRSTTTGSIEINTEDLVCITMELRSGVIGTLQLDYLQRPCARRIHLTGSEGIAIWDYMGNEVTCYTNKHGKWSAWKNPLGYQLNNMYMDEMKHFLDCIKYNKDPMTSVIQALHVLSIINAAKSSAANFGRTERAI